MLFHWSFVSVKSPMAIIVRYGGAGNDCFQTSVLVLSAFNCCQISNPLLSVLNFLSTVIEISCVIFWLGASIVGNQHDEDCVSPCVHICCGLFDSLPVGLMKYNPLSEVIASLPFVLS